MSNPAPMLLKAKHSMVGKSLIPVINQVKLHNDGITIQWARLKQDHSLESYTLNELYSEFEQLTGETMKDVISLTGKDDNISTARLLMHYSIVQANTVGGPRGHELPDKPRTGVGGSGSSSYTKWDNSQNYDFDESRGTMEDNTQSLTSLKKETLSSLKREAQVDESLSDVHIFVARP